MTTPSIPLRSRWSLGRIMLWMVTLAGLTVVAMRLGMGIRSVSNMDNLFSWAYWNGVKLTVVALGAGAFTVCAAVHILNLKEYTRSGTPTCCRSSTLPRRWRQASP